MVVLLRITGVEVDLEANEDRIRVVVVIVRIEVDHITLTTIGTIAIQIYPHLSEKKIRSNRDLRTNYCP